MWFRNPLLWQQWMLKAFYSEVWECTPHNEIHLIFVENKWQFPILAEKKNYRAIDEVNSRFHLRGPRPLLASPGGLGTGKPTPIHSINSRDPAPAASQSPRSPPSQGQPAARDPRPHPGTRTAAHGAPRTPRGPLGETSPPPPRGSRKPGLRRG